MNKSKNHFMFAEMPSAELDGPALGYLLRFAAGAHRLRMERALADLAMTPPQLLVLRIVAADEGCSSADIARKASLTTATVSVIVANLEKRGALEKIQHPVHGRVLNLHLTEDGKALLDKCLTLARHVENELIEGLPQDTINAIQTWLLRTAEMT